MEVVHVLEGGLVRDREDDGEAVPCEHVLLPKGAELLLLGRVQNIQDGPLIVNICMFQGRVLDGGDVVRHKDLLEKLNGEGALAHTSPRHLTALPRPQLVSREVVTGNRTHYHVAGWSDHERDFLGSEQAHLNGVLIVTDFSIAHRYPGACGGAKGNLSHFEITL